MTAARRTIDFLRFIVVRSVVKTKEACFIRGAYGAAYGAA